MPHKSKIKNGGRAGFGFGGIWSIGKHPTFLPRLWRQKHVFQSAYYGLKVNCPSRLVLSACSSGSGTVWGSSADLRRCATILKVVSGPPVLFLVPWRPLALATMMLCQSGRGEEHNSLTLWSSETEWTFPSLHCKCNRYVIGILFFFFLPYFPSEPSRHLSRCWIKLGSTPQTRSHEPFWVAPFSCRSIGAVWFGHSLRVWGKHTPVLACPGRSGPAYLGPRAPHTIPFIHIDLLSPGLTFPSVSGPRSTLCLGDSSPKVFVGLDLSPPLRKPPPDSHSAGFIPLFLF